jgi:hypothetical protein
MIRSGDRFTAKNKLGKSYTYEFVGIDPDDACGNGIILHDLMDDGYETRVELEWFRQRKITLTR